ncbi:MAG: UDP-N-acetylglucosamine 1-carboxyvinyltransferase [Patescibacteria group bacterium]
MEKFTIEGGNPLKGSVTLRGAKNASFKLLIASILTETENTFLQVSQIGDVKLVLEILKNLGVEVSVHGKRTIYVNAKNINKFIIDEKYGQKSRASLMFAGPLLARFGKAEFPMPGGDKIGSVRGIDRHFDGFKHFGVDVILDGNVVKLFAKNGLKGCNYKFSKPTHTGTENMIMTAVLADGKTILENCGLEPEIDDLIKYLNSCGAKIKRTVGRTIEIDGVSYLKGNVHRVIPDRNQAVTFAIGAIITGGDVIIEDANPDHLDAFLKKLDEANAGYEVNEYGIRFFYKGELRPTFVCTKPHPGFMTDWQPIWINLPLITNGTSEIIESVWDGRFQHAEIFSSLGAKIEYFDPKPNNPNEFYNFNINPDKTYDKQGLRIFGPAKLSPINVEVTDLRLGATLLLSALRMNGKSEIKKIEEIDRGYDEFDKKLETLGAKIKREGV